MGSSIGTTSTDPQQQTIRDASTQRLGQRLRRARLSRNLTQGEVARNQFSVSYVSAVERGQIRPSLGALEKLAERLQVPITDLLSDTDFEAKYGITPAPTEPRESMMDRQREEVDARLRDAQALAHQGTPQAVQQAVEMLQRLSSMGPALAPREQATLYWHLSTCYGLQRRGEDARRVALEGIGIAERNNEPVLAARLRFALGNAHALLHANALAVDAYRQCLEAVEAGYLSDPTLQLDALARLGNQYWLLGDHPLAVSYLLRAAQAAESVVNPEALGQIYWSLSRSFGERGDVVTARYYTIKSIAAYEEAESRQSVAGVYNRLGRAYAETGDFDQAEEQLTTASELAAAQRDVRGIAEAQRSLAILALKRGETDNAVAAAEDALNRAEELGDAHERAESLLVWAEVQEHQGQNESAGRSFEEAIELLKGDEAPERLREAFASYSAFLERRGESQRALEMLKQAYNTAARHNLAV